MGNYSKKQFWKATNQDLKCDQKKRIFKIVSNISYIKLSTVSLVGDLCRALLSIKSNHLIKLISPALLIVHEEKPKRNYFARLIGHTGRKLFLMHLLWWISSIVSDR